MDFPSSLEQSLLKREEAEYLRKLTPPLQGVDFYSNDYLGFARNGELHRSILEHLEQIPCPLFGSTGSRLISGNLPFIEQIEKEIADIHNAEAALFMGSGYEANHSLLSCIARSGDTILYDELIHASMREGISQSLGDTLGFHHNDLSDLEDKLKSAKGEKFIAVESVYSMDGDVLDLNSILALAEKYSAHLIIDEAHALGTCGPKGLGLVAEFGLEDRCFARIYTYGKAMGVSGACILGPKRLMEYLVNYSKPLIYSTAPPPAQLIAVKCAYDILSKSHHKVLKLRDNIALFNKSLEGIDTNLIKATSSQIQLLFLADNKGIKAVTNEMIQKGISLKAILAPTVPKGEERIRIVLHSFNSTEEIELLTDLIKGYS